MVNPTCLTDLGNPPLAPIAARPRERQRALRPRGWQPAANAIRRRFDLVAIGFWLGAFALGAGGCIIGACLPYRHPVAVTICVLWWGIYFGSFGAWLGAVIGMVMNTRADASQLADGTGAATLGTRGCVPTPKEAAVIRASDRIRISTWAGQPPYRRVASSIGKPPLE
jgi:hypothetical protein